MNRIMPRQAGYTHPMAQNGNGTIEELLGAGAGWARMLAAAGGDVAGALNPVSGNGHGPDDWLEAQQRIAGWRSTLETAGARVPPVLAGDWGSRSGYELGRRLAADPEVTAVFAANDAMALGLLRALHEAGRTPPSAVSVVGFDDCPEATYFIPPLTTIRQDFLEVGRRALNLMLEEIESGSRSATCPPVPPELVVRQSTGSPRQ